MPLPTALQPAIKRAKKAIQDYQLHPSEEKRKTAEIEIENANKVSKKQGRRRWQMEMLIIPHYSLCRGSWYAESNEAQWSIDKMPTWAQNGKNEPDNSVSILGRAYTKAPPSVPKHYEVCVIPNSLSVSKK